MNDPSLSIADEPAPKNGLGYGGQVTCFVVSFFSYPSLKLISFLPIYNEWIQTIASLLATVVGIAICLGAGLPVVVVLSVIRRDKAGWLWIPACWVALVLGAFCWAPIRDLRFRQFAERSAPLLLAIRDFEAANDRPPTTLEELVPDYLAAVPKTGFGFSPDFHYNRARQSRSNMTKEWAVTVLVGEGFTDFSILEHESDGSPDEDFSNRRRYGDWIYYPD